MQALRFFEAWKEWPCFSMPPAEYFYISRQSLGFLFSCTGATLARIARLRLHCKLLVLALC